MFLPFLRYLLGLPTRAGGWRRRTRWRGRHGLVKAQMTEAVTMTAMELKSQRIMTRIFLVSCTFSVFSEGCSHTDLCFIHCRRSAVHRPAERPRGLWSAWIGRFRLWPKAALLFWGQWCQQKHRPLTWASHKAAARKRQTVPGLPQAHACPTAKLHLLSNSRPSKCRCQAKNLVHCSHCCVFGIQLAGRIPTLYALIDLLLLSRLCIKYVASQSRQATGLSGRHAQRMGGWSFPWSSYPLASTNWGVKGLNDAVINRTSGQSFELVRSTPSL